MPSADTEVILQGAGSVSVLVETSEGTTISTTLPNGTVTVETIGGDVSVPMEGVPGDAEVKVEVLAVEVNVQTPEEVEVDLSFGGGSSSGSGTTWHNGPDAPSDAVGSNGDYYVRDSLLHIYRKDSGTWGTTPIGQWPPFN